MIFEEKFNSSPQKQAYRKLAFAAQNASTAFFNLKLTHMGRCPRAPGIYRLPARMTRRAA